MFMPEVSFAEVLRLNDRILICYNVFVFLTSLIEIAA